MGEDGRGRRDPRRRRGGRGRGAGASSWRGPIPALALAVLLAPGLTGCATMRRNGPSPDLRPGSDGYAYTADGRQLGVRHLRPVHPDPGKLPVVLCHGLGLNATFWTITDNHLPDQLLARGYEVFLFDFRGSGESGRVGRVGKLNSVLRQTVLLELGEG